MGHPTAVLAHQLASAYELFLHSDESGTAPSDVDGYPEVRGSAGVTSRAGEGIRTLDVQLGKLAA